MKQDVLEFLHIISVDTRFISVWKDYLFINNLKFSRFSRRKEELFQTKFPDWKVVRSKIFQKMCIRASRILSKSLTPRETIFVSNDESCANLALYVILESYTRKYGIEIVCDEEAVEEHKVDAIASSLTLDCEVENIIDQMFQGKKIEVMSLNKKYNEFKIIYPLISIPQSWIESWIQNNDLTCTIPPENGAPNDLLKFLESFIPQVRENMLKSAIFVS